MFDYFISLGCSCSTAAAMAKYGLRSFSGPFDWIASEDFSCLLNMLNTGFTNFLQLENLEPNEERNPKSFRDKKSGFRFPHEVNYKTEFDALKDKYNRHIEKFQMAAQKKTCFLRMVAGEQEIIYIRNHAAYIEKTIQEFNRENEIVFFVLEDMSIPQEFPFQVYKLGKPNIQEIRNWFDNSPEFLEFCGQNYSGISMMRNLIIENKRQMKISLGENERYRLIKRILMHDFSQNNLPATVIIYGVGALGRALYGQIRNFTKVKYFIDRSKSGKFQDIPIRFLDDLDDLENTDGAPIIVSVPYDFDVIKSSICQRYGEVPVISVEDYIGDTWI